MDKCQRVVPMPTGEGGVHERAATYETRRVRQSGRILSRLLPANERNHKAVLPVLQLLTHHGHDGMCARTHTCARVCS